MFKSIKSRLFIWYTGSLLILAIFFLVIVHFLAWEYGIQLFVGLFLLLGIIGFFVIVKITKSIDYLRERIQSITYKNLDERILDAGGGDEIEQLTKAFNRLLDRLKEAFDREQQFIADVAHELKTPLATLKSSLEVGIGKSRTPQQYNEIIKSAISETDQLSSTLKNILDLAWAQTPGVKQKFERIDLSQLLEELKELAQKMGTDKKIKIGGRIEKGIEIQGDRDKLARAFLNIIENAIKYNKSAGRLNIDLETVHSKAIVIFKDDGIGIPSEELDKIFDRFYRGTQSRKVFGSGIGLAIAKSMILLHNGEIKVSSNSGKGTNFTVILPLKSS